MVRLIARAEDRWVTYRDPDAFEVLVQRYSGMVLATCTRMLKDPVEAEDVTQECFEILAYSEKVRPNALGSWLYGVATRRCLHRIRSNKRRMTREEEYFSTIGTSVIPQWDDVQVHIDAEIAQLPSMLREPLLAHFIDGKSHAAIARALGVPRRTISHRIERAIGETANGLRRRGVAIGTVSLASLLSVHLAQASTVPTVLAVSLGRIVMSQAGSLPMGKLAGFAMPGLGGMSLLKIAVIAVAALLAAEFLTPRLPFTGSGNSLVAAAPASAAGEQQDVGGNASNSNEAGSPAPRALPKRAAESPAKAVPSVASIVMALSDNLEAQQRQFSLAYTCEERRNSQIRSQPNEYSGKPRTIFYEGEVASNGTATAWREWRWGEFSSFESVPRDRAMYQRFTFDGQEQWRYSKDGRVPDPRQAYLGMERGPGESMAETCGGFPGHFLLGYISAVWFRIDHVLAEAQTVLRPERQVVGGVPCHVIDFESRYGRGTLWVDPEHGYGIAAARVQVRSGDMAHGIVSAGNSTDMNVRDVSFANIEGLWFPISGTLDICGQWGADSESSTRKVVLKNVTRKPDMKRALSRDDILEGTYASYVGERNWYQWKRGALVPSRDPSFE